MVVREQVPTSLWLLPPFPCPSPAGRSQGSFSITAASLGAGWNSSFQRLGVLPGRGAAQGEVEALQDPAEDGVGEQLCEEMGVL